jgi:enterochelin esterase-like enzyme
VHPLRVWMDCGRADVLLEGNRRMAPLLEASGHRVAYREHHAGHNYPTWRDEVAAGLEWLFPPVRRPPLRRAEGGR